MDRRLEIRVDDDAGYLLALLNTTPVVRNGATDDLAADADARSWLTAHGEPSRGADLGRLRAARDLLQGVVTGSASPSPLAPLLAGVRAEPAAAPDGLRWSLVADAAHVPALRALLAWDELRRSAPDRLRPCANDECRLFLLDRSRNNTARWCSMATCGNRMKARRHHSRGRAEA